MKSLNERITVAFLFAGLAASSAWADRYVSPVGGNQTPYDSWAKAATSIQTAINAASTGEKVWVTNGAAFVLSAEIALNKAVTVQGFGEPKPVVNGNGAVRCFNISSSGATLDGLVVSNGYTTGNGGGITMTGGTVQNCSVVTNRANSNGGGIYMTGGTVRDSDIACNRVPTTSGDVYGGGIRMTAGTVTNCTIRFNYCDRRYGGVGLTGASAKLLGCVLEGNRSRTWPGAGAGLEAAALIDGCTFTNNVNSIGGGGVYVVSDGATVRNSFFFANQGLAGGGVSMVGAGLVTNCVFVGNTGAGEGGAMYIEKGLAVNCVMRANRAPGPSGGGGVMSRGTSRAILRNCLIAGNTAAYYAGGVISIAANGPCSARVAARPAAVSCSRPCAGGSAGASPSRRPGQCNGVVRGGRANVLVSRDCMGMRTSERQVQRQLSQFEDGLILENCTIVDNNRAGFFQWGAGTAYATNSIIYFNTDAPNYTAQIGYSCVPGLTVNGNITAAPQFTNRAGGDYALLKTSPCLDAGLGRAWMTGGLDLAGKPRLAYKVHGGTGTKLPDMGAYEYNPPPPVGTTVCVR